MVEINRRIEKVRFANERFTHTNENVVEVKVNSIYEEPTPMDLNAGGLVELVLVFVFEIVEPRGFDF